MNGGISVNSLCQSRYLTAKRSNPRPATPGCKSDALATSYQAVLSPNFIG